MWRLAARGSGVSPDAGSVHFAVSGFPNAPGRDVPVGRQWHKETVDFEVPEKTQWVHFGVWPTKRGVIWVDAVEVRAAH